MTLALLLVGLCACSDPAPTSPRAIRSPRSKTIQGGPDCSLPRKRPAPSWVPEELPLPKGTYFTKRLRSKGSFHRGLFVLRIDAEGFRSFVERQWKAAGITTLRPDREPGEVEDLFNTRGGTGVFKANDVVCDPPYTRLLLIYGE